MGEDRTPENRAEALLRVSDVSVRFGMESSLSDVSKFNGS